MPRILAMGSDGLRGGDPSEVLVLSAVVRCFTESEGMVDDKS